MSPLSNITCFVDVLCIVGDPGDISIGVFVDTGIHTLIMFDYAVP